MHKVIVEYIWIGGNSELRSKARVLDYDPDCDYYNAENIPKWNYDGSSTFQADGHDSEVIIMPQRIYDCPFRKHKIIENDKCSKIAYALMAMCDCYNYKGEPIANNTRYLANNIFKQKLDEHPWFGIEQEFFLMNPSIDMPLGFVSDKAGDPKNPQKQGQYYCSVGINNAFGRNIIDEVMENMIYAGLNISGINAEVAPGQWEYQIGPVEGIDAGDQMWVSRYILERTAEKYGILINYHPKPYDNWNGSGCHTNFSTEDMRNENGLDCILAAIKKLEIKHNEHMKVYGNDNELRMTGKHETASYSKFTYGRANRGASVRIGNAIYDDNKGYFEDRRPASNMDHYIVTSKIFDTVCLNTST